MQFIPIDCALERALELIAALFLMPRVQDVRVDGVAGRRVHRLGRRDLGATHERIGRRALGGMERHADIDPGHQAFTVDNEALLASLMYPVRSKLGLGIRREVRQDQRQAVVIDAFNRVICSQQRDNAFRQRVHHRLGARTTMAGLELLQVTHALQHDPHVLARATAPQREVPCLEKATMPRQAGKIGIHINSAMLRRISGVVRSAVM